MSRWVFLIPVQSFLLERYRTIQILTIDMAQNVINLSTDMVLQKLGLGDHVSGSGSATASQGMLSAKLIQNVIYLTVNSNQKHHYKEWLPRLFAIDSKIKNRIYPSLERLSEEDATQFDKVIKLRKARDEEIDPDKKNELKTLALQELKPATEMPIEIAELCEELAEFAAYVFDHGFAPARGESGVALSSAVSAVAGCLSIIDLNLLSFDYSDDWTEKIRSEKSRLVSIYQDLYSKITERLERLREEADQKNSFNLAIGEFRSDKWVKSQLSYSNIEDIARQLQNTIWKYRNVIWKHDAPEKEVDILKPEIVLEKILGFQFKQQTTLGIYEIQGKQINVAGLIDRKHKVIEISQDYPLEIQNFTAAHELAHALLHQQNGIHRDRAFDGSGIPGPRNLQERQADKFAAYFLMPRKLVESKFEDLFLTKKFKINETTVFALNEGRLGDFMKKCKKLRDLSEFLASVEYYDGRYFHSISKQFRVSAGAMAIRLEELDLVEF